MVSPLGPNPSVCFILPYLLAIPAALLRLADRTSRGQALLAHEKIRLPIFRLQREEPSLALIPAYLVLSSEVSPTEPIFVT